MTKEEWLEYGLDNQWVSIPICITHYTIPMDEEEDQIFINGDSVCLKALRWWD